VIERYHCDISLDRNENPLGFRYHICGVMITWARGKRFSEWGSRAAVPEGVPICLADCGAIDASLPCSEPKAPPSRLAEPKASTPCVARRNKELSRESGVEHSVSSGERAALPGGISVGGICLPNHSSPSRRRRCKKVVHRVICMLRGE
jgi:hypothetical protein